ncbi:MAG: phage tail sheath family protein [Nannocystaceae bacterium]|nr:phage tail sheath subtilisin-like domain-containing protein [bacterium]
MSYLSTQAPGVYVREIPSGVRTIVGGATSITAFVGGAARGPVDTPTSVSGFGEFDRIFGGLHRHSPMSQTLRHFFANGGGQALVVRVVNTGEGITLTPGPGLTGAAGVERFEVEIQNPAAASFSLIIRGLDADGEPVAGVEGNATINLASAEADIEGIDLSGDALVAAEMPSGSPSVPAAGIIASAPNSGGTQTLVLGPAPATSRVRIGNLLLEAASPGRWGDRLTASVNRDDAPAGTFNLVLQELDADGNVAQEEAHLGVSHQEAHPRFLTRVLAGRSGLGRVASATFGAPADTSARAFLGGTDGSPPEPGDLLGSDVEPRRGMYALRHADLFNLLCLPRDGWEVGEATDRTFWQTAMTFVESERAFLIVDPPNEWTTGAAAATAASSFSVRSSNAALVFPRVRAANPLDDGSPTEFPPCGVVAGIIARTDSRRGLWKAPAGIDAVARGIIEPTATLTDIQQGTLNRYGIDAFRTFPVYGTVLWGARTLEGADEQASDWKYISVRRLALYIQENLVRGTQWAVFEPNGEALWAQLRLSVGGFMQTLFEKGAFAGASKSDAYVVECNAQTTTAGDIDRGVVNVIVRFAPLRPAEFVILKIQQMVSQAG